MGDRSASPLVVFTDGRSCATSSINALTAASPSNFRMVSPRSAPDSRTDAFFHNTFEAGPRMPPTTSGELFGPTGMRPSKFPFWVHSPYIVPLPAVCIGCWRLLEQLLVLLLLLLREHPAEGLQTGLGLLGRQWCNFGFSMHVALERATGAPKGAVWRAVRPTASAQRWGGADAPPGSNGCRYLHRCPGTRDACSCNDGGLCIDVLGASVLIAIPVSHLAQLQGSCRRRCPLLQIKASWWA